MARASPRVSFETLSRFAGAEELVKGLSANKGNLQKHPDQIGVGFGVKGGPEWQPKN